MTLGQGSTALVHRQAVDLIKRTFGGIRDLPEEVGSVTWVTVYRSCEIAIRARDGGGSNALLKSMLVGRNRDAYEMERSLRKIEFLKNFIPLIRQAKSTAERLEISSLLVDILKWEILDAGEMSETSRSSARLAAKPDPLYVSSVPDEIL